MDKNYKYTSDGKKVAVIGQLNSNETIVQEIFVSNDVEMPSGENFVVKSLHDAPAISWKEKKINEIEENFSKTQIKYEYELKTLNTNYRKESSSLRALLLNISLIKKNIDNDAFKTMVMFLTGEITHIVKESWIGYEILVFIDAVSENDSSYDSGLKLLTLFGNDKCGLNWKINRYSDGSGSGDDIFPCSSYEAAKSLIENMIVETLKTEKCTGKMIDAKEKYGLSVPSIEKTNEFYEKSIISIRNNLTTRKKEDDKKLISISELAKKIK